MSADRLTPRDRRIIGALPLRGGVNTASLRVLCRMDPSTMTRRARDLARRGYIVMRRQPRGKGQGSGAPAVIYALTALGLAARGDIRVPRPTVYIAAPFELRTDAQVLRDRLEREGFAVQARWLDIGAADSDAMARLCLEDVQAVDALLALNPPEWARTGTGGRHVEFGYALANGKRLVLLGARTNVFHQHSAVVVVETLDAAVAALSYAQPLEQAS